MDIPNSESLSTADLHTERIARLIMPTGIEDLRTHYSYWLEYKNCVEKDQPTPNSRAVVPTDKKAGVLKFVDTMLVECQRRIDELEGAEN